LFFNLCIVLISEQLPPEDESTEEAIHVHDGYDESCHIDLTNQPKAGRVH
jgi:hypothetical protein